MIPTEHVLTWANRIEVQWAQVAVIKSLHEEKNSDAILQKDEGKQRETELATSVKTPARRCKYFIQVHKPR